MALALNATLLLANNVSLEFVGDSTSFSSSTPLNSTTYKAYSSVLSWIISRSRIFLYLSSPYEERFQLQHQIPDYQTEMIPLLLFCVVLEWLVLFLKGRPLPLMGDTFASTSMIINLNCLRLVTRGIEHSVYVYVYQNYRLVDLPWDEPFFWYFAAVFIDFCNYWGHRFSHECNLFWAQHQAHHNAETFTLVNTFRMPLTKEWHYVLLELPMALFVSPVYFLVHLQLNTLYQFWVHTELVGKLGPLEWIFNTPSHHRVHHGSNKFCLDKNYGGWLIIWDRMFGTFQEEKEDEEIVYGLVDPVNSFNPLYLQLYYFGKLYDKFRSMDGWKNKLFSIIKGPGWRPGSPWTGYIEEVPDVKGRVKYSYRPFSFYKSLYLTIHFAIGLVTYACVNLVKSMLSPFTICCHFAYVVLSFTTIGMFYDNSPAAPIVESARCIFLLFFSAFSDISLLTKTFEWLQLTHISLHIYVPLILKMYFLLSAFGWTLVSLSQEYSRSGLLKTKCN